MRYAGGAVLLVLVAAGDVSAATPIRALENVHAPPEAVTAAASGPAVVLVNRLRGKVTDSDPSGCGSGRNYESEPSSGRRETTEPVLWIAGGAAGIGVLVLIGFWLLRRTQV